MKFNPTKTVKFANENKGTYMRVDSLISSVEKVLQDMVARDPLEKCLIELMSAQKHSLQTRDLARFEIDFIYI